MNSGSEIMKNNKKVYTFFESIDGWSDDKDLLKLWQQNWSDKGFEPIVLSLNDAKENPYYNDFIESLFTGYRYVMQREIVHDGNPWNYYVFHNYVRFLAYAHKLDDSEISLVMDYDIYNIRYTHHELSNKKLTFLSNRCPCIVSGTKQQFLSYCKWMAKVIVKYKNELRQDQESSPYSNLHEMALLHRMHVIDPTITDCFENIPPRESICAGLPDIKERHTLVHVSNSYLSQHEKNHGRDHKKLPNEDKIALRVKLAKDAISLVS